MKSRVGKPGIRGAAMRHRSVACAHRGRAAGSGPPHALTLPDRGDQTRAGHWDSEFVIDEGRVTGMQ
jgi:hypothetical protein